MTLQKTNSFLYSNFWITFGKGGLIPENIFTLVANVPKFRICSDSTHFFNKGTLFLVGSKIDIVITYLISFKILYKQKSLPTITPIQVSLPTLNIT